MLKRRNIDGVVLFGFTGITEEMLAHWQSSLVLLARDAKGFASVCYDDEGAIKILMQRLYDQGHRNISYLGVPHSDVTTGKRRHEAYLAFCKAHKLHPVAALPGLAMKQGYENVAKVITPETTALLCATDTLALGASKYLQEQRIDTLQLASVGNTPLMKFLHPGDRHRRSRLRRSWTPGGLPVDRAGHRAQRTATNHHPRHPVLIVSRTINCDLRCVSGTFPFLNFSAQYILQPTKNVICHGAL